MNYQDGKREVGEEAGKKWQQYNFCLEAEKGVKHYFQQKIVINPYKEKATPH